MPLPNNKSCHYPGEPLHVGVAVHHLPYVKKSPFEKGRDLTVEVFRLRP
jgi:hypothetical protein